VSLDSFLVPFDPLLQDFVESLDKDQGSCGSVYRRIILFGSLESLGDKVEMLFQISLTGILSFLKLGM